MSLFLVNSNTFLSLPIAIPLTLVLLTVPETHLAWDFFDYGSST
jgi:hypothetical protein